MPIKPFNDGCCVARLAVYATLRLYCLHCGLHHTTNRWRDCYRPTTSVVVLRCPSLLVFTNFGCRAVPTSGYTKNKK